MKVTKAMLDLAKHIVETKSGRFEPGKFEDHYEATLQDLLERKRTDCQSPSERFLRAATSLNLMSALKARLESAAKGEPAAKASKIVPRKAAAKPKRKAS